MDRYAVFGNPVEHSLSPSIHKAFAKQVNINIEVIKLKPALNEFEEVLHAFHKSGGNGCNITLPFKYRAFACANAASDSAKLANGASCLLLRENGEIFADNFDGIGLVQDLERNNQYVFQQKKILILGAGGATRGIVGPLMSKAPRLIHIANRTADKAIQLAKDFSENGIILGMGLDAFSDNFYDLIVHASSVGHQGKVLSLPETLITSETWVYDLTYGVGAQPFLNWAKSAGAKRCIDGLGMLVELNAATFYLWRGEYPDTQPVLKKLREQLNS